jgi:hypothetical protein
MQDFAKGFFTVRRGGDVPKDAFTVGNLAHDLLVCEFDNVMFCGREDDATGSRIRRNILVCGIVAYIAWALLAAIVSTIPLVGTSAGTLINAGMIALVPVTALHLAYGMGVTCFPLVPTCAVQDLVTTVQVLLPMKFVWPNSLQVLDVHAFAEHVFHGRDGTNRY